MNIANLPVAKTGILAPLRRHLPSWALGSEATTHQMGMMQGLSMLEAGHPGCTPACNALAHWAWSFDPMNRDLLQRQMDRHGSHTFLTAHCFGLSMALAKAIPALRGEDADLIPTWEAIMSQGDAELALEFLQLSLAHPVVGMPWLARCWHDLLLFGRRDLCETALRMAPWPEALHPLRTRLHAEMTMHLAEPEEALQAMDAVDDSIWGAWKTYCTGELQLRAGQQDQGTATLALLWQAMPWHVNLTLKLFELLNPAPMGTDEQTRDVAVLAYSWNKAELLARTLESAEASDLGHARLFVLDNGSTDETPSVLRSFADRLGADRFTPVTLPVNVGAPPARNWLLSLPQVRSCAWAAFLDDDVVLPKDWLKRLLGASRMHTNPGAVGCRITAATAPYGLQSADFNLFPNMPEPRPANELPDRIRAFENCSGGLDTGLYTYSRLCHSVSGCCHMISMDAVNKAGPFDVRFNPSQFDDIDRDLRSCLADMPSVYCGSLGVRHVQHSSLARAKTARQVGHVMGNKLKLDTKYSDADIKKLIQWDMAALWADLETKTNTLLDRFGSPA